MAQLESLKRRRGLWLLLTAWVLVLGLMGSAVGFVMLERYGGERVAEEVAAGEVVVEEVVAKETGAKETGAEDSPAAPAAPAATGTESAARDRESTEAETAAAPTGQDRETVPQEDREPVPQEDREPVAGEETAAAESESRPGPRQAAAAPARQRAAAGDDGSPPWRRYAGEVKGGGGGPRIAVVLTGLGLSAAATEAAIKQLPPAVTLSFSPYARRLGQWIALARVNGHEVMIDLPMEPITFPEDDPGPHALLTFLDSKQNLRRLDWVLDRGESFVGVAAVMGSRFAASEEDMAPVMAALRERGLMFLDNRASDRSVAGEIANRLGLPHAMNDRTLDAAQASRIAINARLTEIERLAEEKGHSIAMAQPYPVTLERLRDWAAEIQSRGYALVPITALAAEQAGG